MSLEALKAQINSVRDLQSVVKTMKALAAVSIRQYERAVESLADYNQTVETGFQILLKYRYDIDDWGVGASRRAEEPKLGAIVFGSDQGLCGQFNEQIATHALEYLDTCGIPPYRQRLTAVGGRVVPAFEARRRPFADVLLVPSSVSAIVGRVQALIVDIEQWRETEGVDRVVLFYNRSQSGSRYAPHTQQLFPLDRQWLHGLETKPWHGRSLPIFTMEGTQLFSALIRQYLFVSLYRAFAESLASENASRLTSMQSAEKNIRERLDELNSQYRRQRQSAITSELLDVVSGFEALQ
ncbi:ATP synthase subunit gamma [Leptolyngbya valderiana BDU 20041]|nr:F0F1 ATP synthase subunit gamma [Geitlerinema sp. CS-897]OAB63672.1 ATP synthase subunit gamma [Leptolyngbya valderiana BDU 20041]PPT09669.1 ATP synthase gamma chain [Geitlerinema sp. FC II]